MLKMKGLKLAMGINALSNPLVERGKLKMTMPEKPKSSNQQFVDPGVLKIYDIL